MNFEDYWRERPKHLRQNVGRYMRRVEQDGHRLELRRIEGPAEIADAVDAYGRLESAGWKGEQGTALHPDNDQGRFYRDLLRAHALDGRARAYMLYLDDRLIAGRLAILGGRMLTMLKTTYDEDLARYAPGRLMLQLVIQDILTRENDTRIEMYTRANRDALDWATESRDLYAATIYRSRALGSLAGSMQRARKHFRRDVAVAD